MNLKSGFSFGEAPWAIYKKQKTNQVFKLLPLKEEEKDYISHIDTILLEMRGINRLNDFDTSVGIQIHEKLEGLKDEESFFIYRKTVFEVITLIEEWGE